MATAVRVRFNDLARGTSSLRDEIAAAIGRVVDRGWFVLGAEGEAFEREFATVCGAAHAVGVASGTDALELALRALELGPGDEVVTQANTCVPTVAAIERAGATPVLCDVEGKAATIDAESFRRAIGPRTRAVVPVHLYGQCGDVHAVVAVAEQHGISVIEDCAQAHGAELGARPAGTIGRLGCFSFYPTKNVGALGDGGAVVTNDGELAERLRRLRQYGQVGRYDHVARGVNSRLDEVQAAVLRVKLPHLAEGNARRAQIAAAYADALDGKVVRPLRVLPRRRHAFHLFVVTAPDRESFRGRLEALGVETLVHYPKPVHGHLPYAGLASGPVELGQAESLCRRVVSLPLYPELSDGEVEHVTRALAAAAEPSADGR